MRKENPKISIIVPSLNTGLFLRQTLDSILSQSYKNYEVIVVDGASRDETVDILKDYAERYGSIKWISEKDDNILEAYRKGFAASSGDCIMLMCVSDGYLNKNWFNACVDALDSDKEVSLVWGLPQIMEENGKLGKLFYGNFFRRFSLQKRDFFYFWLHAGFHFPEGNFCVRRDVFDKCFPVLTKDSPSGVNPFTEFNYNFHTRGYLSHFIPIVANYYRRHSNQRGKRQLIEEQFIYHLRKRTINSYRQDLVRGKTRHFFKNGFLENAGEAQVENIKKFMALAVFFKINQIFTKNFEDLFGRILYCYPRNLMYDIRKILKL